MIHRVQSVYLFFALIIMGLMFFFPLARFFDPATGSTYALHLNGIYHTGTDKRIMPTLPLFILTGFVCLLLLIDIYLYKRRVLQGRICVFGILLMLGLTGLIYYYLKQGAAETRTTRFTLSLPAIFPLITAVLTYLAYRGIRKDEALVRSIDRIR